MIASPVATGIGRTSSRRDLLCRTVMIPLFQSISVSASLAISLVRKPRSRAQRTMAYPRRNDGKSEGKALSNRSISSALSDLGNEAKLQFAGDDRRNDQREGHTLWVA